MRDEWSQGLTPEGNTQAGRGGRGSNSTSAKSPRTIQSLTMASRAMKLKVNVSREISERRQVGDAEEMVNPQPRRGNAEGSQPWWKNVGMDEGL